MTKRTSRKLYSNIQEDYKKIKNDYTFDSLIKDLESEKDSDENFIIAATIIAVALLIFIIVAINGITRRLHHKNFVVDSSYFKKFKVLESLIFASIGVILMIGVGIATCIIIIKKIDDLSNSLKDIKNNATANYALVKNIKDDEQYFEGDGAQVKWDNGGNTIWRSKKYYYQRGYKESKGKDASGNEIQSDCDEYLGGKKNAEKVRNDASDLLVACIVSIVIVGIIVILILVFLVYVVHELQELRNTVIRTLNDKVANENDPIINRISKN